MSVDLEQLAADIVEIKKMLSQLLSGGAAAPPISPIMEALRAAEALGLDPVQAMAPFRVTGQRGRPKKNQITKPSKKKISRGGTCTSAR